MSNDGAPPPPPPPPPPSAPGPGDPTPEQGLAGLAVPPQDGEVPAPVSEPPKQVPIDATQVMPVVASLPLAAASVPPSAPANPNGPGAVMAVPLEPDQSEPWYKNPGVIASVALGLFVIAGAVAFFFIAQGGDEDADGTLGELSADPVSLVVVRETSAGQAINTSISTSVVVAGVDPTAYEWVVPVDAVAGVAAVRSTDGTGRVEFRWSPSSDVDLATWATSVELAEFVASEGETPVESMAGDCVLERDGRSETIVLDGFVLPDAVNDSLTRIGNYTFPNARFEPGDRVTCTLTNVIPGTPPPVIETTTVPESTTTLVETTTVPDTTTTVPETTTTTTTIPETTTTSTTTSTTVAPPTAPALGAFLRGQNDLTEAVSLLDRVGLLDELEAADDPFTIFVPTNDAIDALRNSADAPDLDDDDVVRALFEAHVLLEERLDGAALRDTTEVEVANGGSQLVDAAANPLTVGGVDVIRLDNAVENGVVHVLDGVLTVQP